MSRLISAVTACLLSTAATWTGLANAQETPSTPVSGQPAQASSQTTAEAPQSPELPDVGPGPQVQAADTDWPSLIESRLTALAPRSPRHSQAPSLQLAARLGPTLDRAPAVMAVHVRDLGTGATLFDHRGARTLNPASNQKILTGSAAVELLGPEYRFETRLVRRGSDLVLVGEGDPQLRVHDLYALAADAQAQDGLDGVERIVVDDSAFGSEYEGRAYIDSPTGDAYLAPSGALSLEFNTVEVHVRPATVQGQPPRVEISPAGAAVELDIRAVTQGPTRLHVNTRSDGGTGTIVEVHGSIAYGATGRSVRRRVFGDPALHTGSVLAHIVAELDEDGGRPLGVVHGHAGPDDTVVARHDSVPLRSVLASAMKYSNNFTSEMVLRTLGWRATGEGTFDAGLEMLDTFRRSIGGASEDWQSFNGSGLSRGARVAPRAIVDLLALATDPTTPAGEFLGSWAEAGGEGTMRHRLRGTKGRIRAKTGTMFGVSALSGIVYSRDGSRQIGFSILVNAGRALDTRDAQDQVARAIMAYLDWDRP